MLVHAVAFVVAAHAMAQGPASSTSKPAVPSKAEASAPAANTATAVRAAQPPKLDGKDDDAVWQAAPRHSGFRQFEPKVDIDPSFRTEFRVAYDEKNLYVFVRMFDPHPDSIRHALSRRDQRGPSDQIKLLVDSYDDKLSGYEFAVNPDGVKRDFVMSNDGNEDGSWNGVWDVAVRVDELGWTAEYQIPLSQLRYASAESHTFGFGIWRDIERFKERDAWPLWNPKKNGIVSQLGRLEGLAGLTSARRLEVTPYTVTKNVQRALSNAKFGREQQTTIGGDLKIGLTPNITLDGTVNPDFGQVEADPAVVNLTAFETFFSEKRPFFVEGTGLYRFQLNCYIVVDCSTNEGLFYSRRIGRSPALRGLYGDAGTATATPIAAATKLTGRTRDGLAFGLIDAVTPRVAGINSQTVEPQTNFAVLRGQQDFDRGNTSVGLIGTAVNRSLDRFTDQYMHKDAYAVGGNFRQRYFKGDYEFNAQLTASQVSGTRQAIARTQNNSVHYFQQPGDDLQLDTTRTSLSGYEGQLKFGKYGGGITRFETSVVQTSAGFDVNDLGYLRRGDYTDWSTWSALTWKDAKWIYRWAQLNGNHWIRYNTSGKKLDHSVNVNGHMGLRVAPFDNWDVHLGGTLANITNTFCDRCTRGGPVTRQSGGFYPWGGFNTDSRRTVSGGMWVNLGWWDEGKSNSVSYSPYLNFLMGTQLTVGLGLGYSTNTSDAQWFGNFTDAASTTHYSFAHLDQTTVSTSLRVNYTATPDLTFEFYGAPFVSNGTYSNVRQVSATPEAAAYADRFAAYTAPAGSQMAFKFTQLRTNAVVRWEFRPGSTAFLVWQHGRQDSADQASTQSWYKDYNDLMSLHPDNTFLVKLAYWLSR